jgi:hypothetical protein
MLHETDVQPGILATSHYDYPVIAYARSGSVNIVMPRHEGKSEQSVTQALAL